ncbi:MAG: ABC transporter substrate-binding protein [Flavobacteriales bacterium]
MKYYIWVIALVIGCTSKNSQSISQTKQYVEHRPEFARGFNIFESEEDYKLLLFDVTNPSDTIGTYFIPKNLSGNLACLSTTHVSFLHRLGALEQLKGVTFASYIRNEKVQKLVAENKILDLTSNDEVSMEKLISIQPDYFFVYPFGYDGYDKYTKKGINCIPISEYLEYSPLGRAEWIKVIALFCNKPDEANQIFSAIKQDYTSTSDFVKNSTTTRPCVFTGSNDQSTWFAPPGNSFVAKLIEDAGASYVLSDTISNENIAIPFERLYKLVENCDYWGKVEYRTSDLNLTTLKIEEPLLYKTRAFQNHQVFNCNTALVDYFGDAILEPQIFLKDLTLIFHPELKIDHSPTYFKMLQPN